MSCGWPFHNDASCAECRDWEDRYGMLIDAYLEQIAERKRRS